MVFCTHSVFAQFQFLTILNDSGIYVTDIDVINQDSIFVCTGTKMLRTLNGGNSWDTLMSPGTFWYADFYDFNHGFAISRFGYIIKTTNGGLNWDTVPNIPANTFFYDVHMVDSVTALASADSGYIFTVFPGGYDIDTLIDVLAGSAPLIIKDFDFESPLIGFGGGATGNGLTGLARTTDGGNSWEVRATSGFLSLSLDEISAFDSLRVWGIEIGPSPWEHIAYSTDGGYYWDSGYLLFSTAKIASIDFTSNGFGLVAKPLEILYTVDTGVTWNTLIGFQPNFPGLTRIKIVNDSLVYVGGRDAIYKITYPLSVNTNEPLPPMDQSYFVFPNPVTEKLIIEANNNYSIGHMMICDLLGRSVLEKYLEIGTNSVDVSFLESGFYLLTIEEKNGNTFQMKINKSY